MSNWITRSVEKERCVLTASDVWAQAMNEENRNKPYFAVGVGFPEGSFLDGFNDKWGFYTVSSGLMVCKDEKYILVAQNSGSYSNYVARIVGEHGYKDGQFSFAGDVHTDYRYARGVNGNGVEELIKGFDVTRHTVGVVNKSGSRGWNSNRTSFI